MKKTITLVLVTIFGLTSQSTLAISALCEGEEPGTEKDISGYLVPNDDGKILVPRSTMWFGTIDGFSDGKPVKTSVYFPQGLYDQLLRCRVGSSTEISVRIRCNKRENAMAYQVVCD